MPSKTTRELPPIPPAFADKKRAILASLAVPSSDYKDLSPKGSVDEGILSLIARINTLDGVVTTSSCAGRVSVFLEGCKSTSRSNDGGDGDEREHSKGEQVVVVGGKGNGGRWLFVSHEPVDLKRVPEAGDSVMDMVGISRRRQKSVSGVENGLIKPGTRLARFQFEPMILHIMTASLAHASAILTAAINAGFRESGVQSLKNLDDPLNAFPMVAVRTSGLALESVIGYVNGNDTRVDETKEDVRLLVGEDYLVSMLEIANERFKANEQRKKKFEAELFQSEASKSTEWETRQSRQARKRADGLARQHALKNATNANGGSCTERANDDDFDLLIG